MGVSSSTPEDKPEENVTVVLDKDNDNNYVDEEDYDEEEEEINELTVNKNNQGSSSSSSSTEIKKRGRKKKDNTATTTTTTTSSTTTPKRTMIPSSSSSSSTSSSTNDTELPEEPKKGFRLDASAMMQPDTLSTWLSTPISDNLFIIPGIGDSTATILINAGYTTPYKLIGKYLSFRNDGMESQEHCDLFYNFLGELGVRGAYRAVITRAIAEKMNLLIPGIFREDELRH